MERVAASAKTILEAAGMPTVRAMIFSYNMIMKQRKDAVVPTRF